MEPPANRDSGQFDSFGTAPAPGGGPIAPEPTPIPDGRTVSIERGFAWIGEAWRMFKDAPGSWVACFVIFIVIMIVLAVIPVLGSIAGAVISPVLIAGMMAGSRALERNDEMTVSHLFAGFSAKAGPLLVLGLIEFGISLVVMLIAAAIIFLTVGAMFLGVLVGQTPDAGSTLDPRFWIGAATVILVVIALFIPVTMAVWFAPALVMLDGIEPWAALKSSFMACLRNMGAFLIYGIVWIVLGIVATIPLGLGWLILGPMTIASVYTAYRDIYVVGRTDAATRIA